MLYIVCIKSRTLSQTHPDFLCDLLLLVVQLHAGAFSRREVFGGRNHLPIFKLQIFHEKLQIKQASDETQQDTRSVLVCVGYVFSSKSNSRLSHPSQTRRGRSL